MIKMRMTRAMIPTRKNLECKILLSLKPDLPPLDAVGLELAEI